MRISLKTKMSLVLSGLFILFSVGFAWQTLFYFEDEFKKSIFNQQVSLADSLANGIDDKLAIAHKALISTAAKIPLHLIQDADSCQRFLDGSTALLSIFDNSLTLFSSQGNLIVESPFISRERRGLDFSFSEYFRITVASGKPYISVPYASSHEHGHPTIMLTAPIFDKQGRLIAILGGSFDLKGRNIIRELDSVKVGVSGYVYLSDSDRTLLVHPGPESIMKRVKPGLNYSLDRAVEGFEGYSETVNSRGVRQLITFRRLRTTGWVLGVVCPVAEAYGPLHEARRNFILVALSVISVALLLVWLVMKKMTSQLRLITKQIAEFPESKGEPKLIEIDSSDEIGALARAFNTMVSAFEMKRQAQEESEAKLEDERLLLTTLLQTLPDPVWFKDVNGVYIICNVAFGHFYDDTPSGIVGRTDNDYVDAKLAAYFQQTDREAMAASYPRTIEEWVTFVSDGHQALWETTKIRVCDASGGVVGVLGVARDITDRKRAEDLLCKRNQEFSALVENSPDTIVRYDRDCRRIYLNPAMGKLFRCPAQELLGKKPTNFSPLLDPEKFEQKLQDVWNSGCEFQAELPLLTAIGEFKWSHLRVVPEFDTDGTVMSLLAIGRDITSLKNTELQLREARSRLSAVLNTIPDMVWMKSEDGVYLACNPAFENFFGATEADIVGKTDHDFVAAEMTDFFTMKDREAIATDTICINEGEITYADDGRKAVLETRKVAVYCPDGTILGVLGISRDITARKKMEDALKNSERRLADIINLLPDPTFAIDLEGKVTVWNRAAEKFTGTRAEDMLGKGNYEHAIPFYGVRRPILIDLVLNPSEKIERLYPYAKIDDDTIMGEAYTLSVKRGEAYMFGIAALLYDSGGRVVGAIESVRDITDRKKAELRLAKLAETSPGVLFTFLLRPDGTSCMQYISPRIKELNGLCPEEMAENMAEAFARYHPDDALRVQESIAESARALSPWQIEFRMLNPGKGEVWVEGHSLPELQPNGAILWYGFLHDITERKLAAEALSVKREQVTAMAVELSLAEERERRRIAAVLHDHIGQTLLLSRIKLGTLAEVFESGSNEKTYEEIQSLLEGTIRDIRSLTQQLHPPVLASVGLEATLEWLAKRMEEDYSLLVDFVDDRSVKPLSEELSSVVYQAARELLINVAKHAATSEARLTIGREADILVLVVEDEGAGFACLPDSGTVLSLDCSFGLFNIRQRIKLLGGVVAIRSSPGCGTCATIRIPLANSNPTCPPP